MRVFQFHVVVPKDVSPGARFLVAIRDGGISMGKSRSKPGKPGKLDSLVKIKSNHLKSNQLVHLRVPVGARIRPIFYMKHYIIRKMYLSSWHASHVIPFTTFLRRPPDRRHDHLLG